MKKTMSLFGKIASAFIAVLSFVLLVFFVVEKMGYPLIDSYLNQMGVLVLLIFLLITLGVWIVKKLKNRAAKVAVGMLFVMIVMLGSTFMLNLISEYVVLFQMSRKTTLTAPNGDKYVVMYGVDTGYQSEEEAEATKNRMDERKAYILENNPEEAENLESEDDYPTGAYGYYYVVYPRVAGIFYDKNADVEGKVYMGINSTASLKYEFKDDGTVHLYLENPEAGDEGEVVLNP